MGIAAKDYRLFVLPTNLFLTLSVPQRNLAGWQNSRCSEELAGKFVTAEGSVLESDDVF